MKLANIRRKVIIESPYAGDVEANMAYAYAAVMDSLRRGEAPFASHIFYTQFLDDDVPEERMRGIESGFAWWSSADLVVFYTDLGWSRGMLAARERLHEIIIPFVERKIR